MIWYIVTLCFDETLSNDNVYYTFYVDLWQSTPQCNQKYLEYNHFNVLVQNLYEKYKTRYQEICDVKIKVTQYYHLTICCLSNILIIHITNYNPRPRYWCHIAGIWSLDTHTWAYNWISLQYTLNGGKSRFIGLWHKYDVENVDLCRARSTSDVF